MCSVHIASNKNINITSEIIKSEGNSITCFTVRQKMVQNVCILHCTLDLFHRREFCEVIGFKCNSVFFKQRLRLPIIISMCIWKLLFTGPLKVQNKCNNEIPISTLSVIILCVRKVAVHLLKTSILTTESTYRSLSAQ